MKRILYLGNVWEYPLALAEMPGIEVAGLLYEGQEDAEEALRVARKTGAQTYRVGNDGDVQQALEVLGRVDLGIIANFGIILSARTLELAARGFINCHPGLLPDQKGREPVTRIWTNGGGAAGMTIHVAEAVVDSGAILATVPYQIDSQQPLDKILREIYRAGLAILKESVLTSLKNQ
jgi:methionyl-tRNA formyltransferase